MRIGSSLVLFFFLIITSSHAQVGYNVKQYTSDNGLPQNSIKSISADSEGFIWLATEDGLTRFDGRDFFVYNRQNINITSNRFFFIQSRIQGNYLQHHDLSKVSYAYAEGGDVIKIEKGKAIRDSLYYPNWLNNLKSVELNPSDFLEASGFPNILESGGTPKNYLIFTGNNDKNFFLCNEDRITYFTDWKKKYVMKFPVNTLWHFFSIGRNLHYFDENGLITTIFDGRATTLAFSGDILAHASYKNSGRKFQLYWNHNSSQAFIYFKKNLYILEPQKNGNLVTKLLIEDFDFASRSIEQIHFDKISQKIFLGSRVLGLFVLTKQQFQTINLRGDNFQNVFYAQIPYNDNSILTSTGLIIGEKTTTEKAFEASIPIHGSLFPDDKRALLRDKNGCIWIKSGENLFYLDKKGLKTKMRWRFAHEIKTIHQGKSGPIWFSLSNGELYRIKLESRSLVPELVIKDSALHITYLESLSSSKLLVGTDKGLCLFVIPETKLTLINQTKGLYIKSIHLPRNGQIWFTALGKGLVLIKDGYMTSFPLDKNRYLTTPHCIVDDGLGFFWVPTNKGLFQMAIKDLLIYASEKTSQMKKKGGSQMGILNPDLFYIYHAMEEGFKTNEFNGNCQPCSALLKNSYISLPSMEGLVWFNPRQINNYVPDGQIIFYKAEANQLQVPLDGDSITFQLSPENIRLHFTAAYFGNDYNLNLSYALVKPNQTVHQSDWIPLENKDLTVRYSSLNSGNYLLIVRKFNGFGINNYSFKKIYLIVPYRWFETPWAVFLFIVAVISVLIFSIYLYNVHRLRKIELEKTRLEVIIEQRTESLNQALNKVEESNGDLEQQMHIFSRIVASISHDVQSPLRYIAFASQKIPQMLEMNQMEKASKLGTTIFDMSDRMSSMLMDLLDFIKVTVYGKRMHFENVSLKKLVDSKLELFKNLVDRNNSYLINDIPNAQIVFSDYQFLSIVIHNLIDNAAKYTYNGQVRIHMVTDTEHKAELVISNTGRGIPLQMVEMMNSPIEDKSLDDLMESGTVTGLGLLIVKEMGKLAGVTIKVTQTDVTSFHLVFRGES